MSIDNTHADITGSSLIEQMGVRVRGATAAELSTYTGTAGEIWFDETNSRLLKMDGTNAGGRPIADVVSLTSAETAAFTGYAGQITYNSTNNQLVVHDGSTAGGSSLSGASPLSGANWNIFRFFFRNNSGTLQHAVNWGDSTLRQGFNGLSETYTATPNGTDASTAMAAGCKISSAVTNTFIFDTTDISSQALMVGTVTVQFNNTGATIRPNTQLVSRDVNGVTITRFEIALFTAAGADLAINTTNFTSGEQIEMTIMALMPNYSEPDL